MELEKENQRLLICARRWLELYKNDNISLLHIPNSQNLMEEFFERKEDIVKHLLLLKTWLASHGVKEAMNEMPTVGKMLSLLCRLPFVVACESFSALLVDCMLHLSNLFASEQSHTGGNNRAKCWAIKNFSTLSASKNLDDVSMFVMDEFGVSQHECIQSHLQMLFEDLCSSFIGTSPPTCAHTCQPLDVCEYMDNLINIVVLNNDQTILPVVDKVIHAEYGRYTTLNNYNKNVAMDRLVQWLLDTPLLKRLDVDGLAMLFEMNFHVYEHYVMLIIEECLKHFPFVCTWTIEQVLREFKLADLLQQDNLKFLQGFRAIMRNTLSLVGNHPVLMLLVIVSENIQRDVTTVSSTDDNIWLSTLMRELRHVCAIQETDKRESECFKVWFTTLGHYTDLQRLLGDIFRYKSQNIDECVDSLLWLFYPTAYPDISSCKLVMVTYIKALRNVTRKNYLQVADIQHMLTNQIKNLPADMSTILIFVHVMFCATCYGARLFVDSILTMVFDRMNDDHVILWCLNAMESLTKTIVPGISEQAVHGYQIYLKKILYPDEYQTSTKNCYKVELCKYLCDGFERLQRHA